MRRPGQAGHTGTCPPMSRGTDGTHPYRGVPCPGMDNGSEPYIKRPLRARYGSPVMLVRTLVNSPKALRVRIYSRGA